MNKYEKIRQSLLCQVCSLIYENPVKLPCHKMTLCKSHLIDSNESYLKEFECRMCQIKHTLPTTGLHSNFFIQQQIKENHHLSETELNLKCKLEQSLEKMRKICSDINEAKVKFNLEWSQSKSIREEKLNKLKQDLCIQFRQVKIDVEHLQKQYLEIGDEIYFLREELENITYNETSMSHQNFRIISCHNDGSIAMRDFQDLSQFYLFDGDQHDGSVNCILVSLDNQTLISGGRDGCIKIWSLKTGRLLKSVLNSTPNGHCWNIKCMINSCQPNEILIGSTLSDIRIFDLNTLEFDSSILLRGHARMVTCLEFLTHERLLSSCDASIKVWNFKSKKCIQTLKSEWCEQAVAIRKINASKFICGYQNQTIRIWSCYSNNNDHEEEKFECIKVMKKVSDGSILIQLEVNLYLNLIMCCSDRSISIWRLDDFTFVSHLRPEGHLRIRSFEMVSNKYLFIGTYNYTLELLCLKTGKSLKVLKDISCLINQIKIYFA